MSDYFPNRFFPAYFPAGYFGASEEQPPGSIFGSAHGSSSATGTLTAIGHLSASLSGSSAAAGAITDGAAAPAPVVSYGGGPARRARRGVEIVPAWIRGSARGHSNTFADLSAVAHARGSARGTSTVRATLVGVRREALRPVRPVDALRPVRPLDPIAVRPGQPLRAVNLVDYLLPGERLGPANIADVLDRAIRAERGRR